MIIDTPGRGLGVENLNNVYTHFLKTNPQVIFLPNDLELDPEFGDNNYGKYVGTTYELSKVEGDRTEVIPRLLLSSNLTVTADEETADMVQGIPKKCLINWDEIKP